MYINLIINIFQFNFDSYFFLANLNKEQTDRKISKCVSNHISKLRSELTWIPLNYD